jgi:hypothetical protein
MQLFLSQFDNIIAMFAVLLAMVIVYVVVARERRPAFGRKTR